MHTAPSNLTPPQREVLDAGLLDSGFAVLLHMPTGSGKTWLAEQSLRSVLQRGRRAIYLTPLRALAAELAQRWGEVFAPHPVGVFTGDYGLPGRPSFATARVLIMTPERLDAVTRAWRAHWGWLPEVDLCVVDEFHLLGDRHRGARLEGTLSRLTRLNPFARLLALSATLGNPSELADWLSAVEHGSAWRPIPLEWRVVRFRRATDKPDLLREEVARCVRAGGRSLVFVQSRRRAEEIAGFLSRGNLRAAHHHAGLSALERGQVEREFRAAEMDVLVSTGTLEMGLNLPVRQVILFDLQAWDGLDYRPLPVNTVWQRAGRAGRPGLDSAGEVVLLAPAWERLDERYVRGEFEPIRSALADAPALAEQVVAEVACGLCRTPAQLKALFARSLAARQGTLPDVGPIIAEMTAAGLLAPVRETELRATPLGHTAARHLLAPATVLLFRPALAGEWQPTFFDLLLLVSSAPDCEPVLPVDFENLEALADRLADEPSLLLRCPRRRVTRMLGIDGRRLLSALAMALVLRAWTRRGDVDGVAEEHGCYPFEVQRLVQSSNRLLAALESIASVPEVAGEPARERVKAVDPDTSERVRALARMVSSGLDEETVTLTLLAGVGPKTASKLHGAGLTDLEALALADTAELPALPGIAAARLKGWIEEAGRLLKTTSAWRYRERTRGSERCRTGWPVDVEPYRLRRALDLRVVPRSDGFEVTGGTEPHRVLAPRVGEGSLVCDCRDAAARRVCKHVLAVRLHTGDVELARVAEQMRNGDERDELDVYHLWMGPTWARDSS